MATLPIIPREWNHLVSNYSGLDRYSNKIIMENGVQSRATWRTYPLINENGCVKWETLPNTYFRDTPFHEIRKILEFFDFGKGKYGIDIGSGGGAVCAVGHLLGAHMVGVEIDKIMYDISLKAWGDFENGIDRKAGHKMFYLEDGLKFRFGYADFIWSYLIADKQPRLLEEFMARAKKGSSIVLRHPTPKCYEMAKGHSLEQMSSDDLSETLILRLPNNFQRERFFN